MIVLPPDWESRHRLEIEMLPYVTCHCGQKLPVLDEPEGRQIECPACDRVQWVPGLQSMVACQVPDNGSRVRQLAFDGDDTLHSKSPSRFLSE